MADFFKLGSWATDDSDKIVSLRAHVYGTAYHSTFLREDKLDHNAKGMQNLSFPRPVAIPTVPAGNGYQVPAGTEFRITSIRVGYASATTHLSFYTTSNDLGWDAVAAGTDPKALFGTSSSTWYNGVCVTDSTEPDIGNEKIWATALTVAAGRYINVQKAVSAACGISLFGYEITI